MKEEILAALADWNPWFNNQFPATLYGYSRAYEMISYLELPEIKILEGARRVGKSTLLYQVIDNCLKQKKKVLYINFDDGELKKYPLKVITNTFLMESEFDCLFLDEIQHCIEWEHYVRNIYDRKEVQQIWITGSNTSLIKPEYKTLLTGRNITLSVYPLSFKEYLQFKNCTLSRNNTYSQRKAIEIKRHFNDYVAFGGFPAIVLREIYKKELLINYFEDFIYKDIATRHVVNTAKLKELGLYLATNCGKLFSYRGIANTLGIHLNTLIDYLSYYQEIFLFREVYKFDYSLKKQFTSEKKIYSLDTGIAAAISFQFSADKGRMLENLVYNQLAKLGEVYFHKDKKECDFILKNGYEITQVIQVCATLENPQTKLREIEGVRDALRFYENAQALILTEDETAEELAVVNGKEHPVTIIPIWKWLLSK